jgi:hypothetical protein
MPDNSETFQPDSPIAQEIAVGVPPPQDLLTQEQIESRHRLVALHRETREGHHPSRLGFVEELSQLPVDEARERIRELRRIEQETGKTTTSLQQYNAYVTDLREIRAEQREHIAQELEKIPEDATPQERREVFIMALDHSPPLATRTLEKVNELVPQSMFSDNHRKMFSDEQISEIAQDPEKFKQALKQAIIDEPEMVIRTAKIMEQVASPEDIRSALDTLQETKPDMLLSKLPYVMRYYSRDEARILVTTLAEKNPGYALYDIMNPDISELIGEDAVARIANKALEGNYLPLMSCLEECIKQGFFTKEALKVRILKDLEPRLDEENESILASDSGPQLHNVENLMRSELYTSEEKAEIHDKVLMLFQNADDTFFRSLESTSILTEEEKIALFTTKFTADPMGAMDKYASMVSTFTDPEVARETILQYIRVTGPESYKNAWSILDSSALTIDDKRNFVLEIHKNNPDKIFGLLYKIDGSYNDEIFNNQEIAEIIRNTFETIDMATAALHLVSMTKYIDSSQLKPILIDKFTHDPSTALFVSRNKEVIDQLFTKEEQLNMLNTSIDHQLRNFSEGDNTLYEIKFSSIKEIFGDEILKNVADKVLSVSPDKFISSIGSISYLYEAHELTEIVLNFSQTIAGQRALFTNMMFEYGSQTEWSSIVDKDVVRKLILEADPEIHRNIILVNDKLERYLTQQDISSMASNMLEINPIIALRFPDFFAEHVPGFEANQVLSRALQDQPRMAILGKYFDETLQRAQKTDREAVLERLLKDAEYMYLLIERQSRSGSLESYSALHSKFELNPKTERSLFETYSIISDLGTSEDIALLTSVESIIEVEKVAAQVVARSLGIEEEINIEASQKLLDQLGSIIPLGLYVAQYRSSPAHAAVLKPMVEATLNGTYESWKFGTGPDSLSSLKVAGLIPPNLTEEQYAIWQQETQTERTETFTVETTAVIDEIRTILNDEELQLPAGSLIAPSEKVSALDSIAVQMPELGKEIASIHQELKILREQPDQELAKVQITELERNLSTLELTRKELQIQQDIIQLTNLSEEEVRSGVVQKAGGKGRPIIQIVQRLSKNINNDVQYVVDRLETVLDSYKQQTGNLQVLRVSDTASPKITMEIGELPLSSCQNFRNGIMNQALMGYTDPNTKILLLANERGNPVARSVFRILSDEAGNPVLHAETIYTTEVSEGVSRAMYQHAIEKAESMGMPLFISSVSQNDEGHMVGTRDIEGITRTKTESVLSSAGSRAPSVYVDSAGGERRGGVYSFTNVVTLST